MRPLPRLLLLFAVLLPAVPAPAASFDCSKKLNQIETLICADAELSTQDNALAGAYSAAARQGSAAQQSALRRDERQWISHRNAACALSDIDNVANRIAVKRCVFSDTGKRIELLKAIAAGAPLAPPAGTPQAGDEYRRGANDTLQLTEQADGKAGVAIIAGNARGVCDIELEGRRLAPGRYLFTDADSGCSVSVEVAGNSATVDSSGACLSLCGTHAPGFTGTYLRKPGPRAATNKN